MGIKCSKCCAPQSETSSTLLYDEYSCRCHVYTDNNDKICKDCNRNLLNCGNCRHRFKYSVGNIFCCYA